MSPLDFKAGVRRLFRLEVRRPADAQSDADAELEALIDEQVRFLTARGYDAESARAEAFRRLGAPLAVAQTRLRESATRRERRMRLNDWLDDAATDWRYAVRGLRKNPGLAAAAIVTLALAGGANTAIFSAVYAVILRPLPVADPARLVMLWEKNPDFGWDREDAAPANMLDWKEQTAVFSGVAAYPSFSDTETLTGRGDPRLVVTQDVTGNFFDVLGVRPVLGRVFRDEETWAGSGPPSAVLSHRAWRDVFGADSSVVGRTVQLGGRPVEVIGVLPRDFGLPGRDPDLWRPVAWDRSSRSQVFFRRAHWLRVVARLKPGVTLAGADAALQTVVTRLQHDYPATNTRMGAGLTPLHEFLVGKTRLPLLVMFGGAAVLLLIACTNVANLILVRAAAREREGALRLALGAGRGRLLRQSLAEGSVLAAVGGAAGLVLGWWGTGVLMALQPAGMVPVKDVGLSWPVLWFVAFVTMLSAAVFGVVPAAWSATRTPADVLREEGRTATGTRTARRFGDLLLGSQVALVLALTVGAGLLVRSYLLLQRVEPGFDSRGVLAVTLGLPGSRYDSTRKVLAFFEELKNRARELPGAESVGLTSFMSLGPPAWTSEFAIEGAPPFEAGRQVLHREVAGEYFRTMRVPIVAGRALDDRDRSDSPNVVIINQTLARSYFGGQDPLGRKITFDRVPDSTAVWRTIVGVAGDERQGSLAVTPQPEIIAPYQQEPRREMTVLVRTRGLPAPLGSSVRRLVADLDPALAIASIRTAEEVRAASLGRDRFLTVLILAFAVVGLVLGLVGVYGVVAQVARRRLREMAIRMTLGAGAAQVQWLVVRHGVIVTAAGAAIGIGVALGATRAMRSLLYQVAPNDPVVFVGVPLLVLATAALAAWLPAARASRSDPGDVLRA